MRDDVNPRVRGTDTSIIIEAYLATPENITEIPDVANVVIRFYGRGENRKHPFSNTMENYIILNHPSLKQEIEIAKKLGPKNLSYEAWLAIEEWDKTTYGRFGFELEKTARTKYNGKYEPVSKSYETVVEMTRDRKWKRIMDYSEYTSGKEVFSELKLTGKELKELSEKAFEQAKIPLNGGPVINENIGKSFADIVTEKTKQPI